MRLATLTAVMSSVLVLAATTAPAQTVSKTQSTTRGDGIEHAVVGTIERVDAGAQTVVIKTVEGTEEALKLTESTVVRAAEAVARPIGTAGRATKQGAAEAALAGKKGSVIIARYTTEGSQKTAMLVEHAAASALRMTKGLVIRVGDAGQTVVVKTADGTEETFHFAERGIIDGERGVMEAATFTGMELKAGEQVTVHYTESARRKVAHLVKRVG